MGTPVIKIFKPVVSAKGNLFFRKPTNNIKSQKVKDQNANFRKAAIECHGKKGADFTQCMSDNI